MSESGRSGYSSSAFSLTLREGELCWEFCQSEPPSIALKLPLTLEKTLRGSDSRQSEDGTPSPCEIAEKGRHFARAVVDLPSSLWPAPGASKKLAIVLGERALRVLDEQDNGLRALVSARIAAEL